MIDWSTVAQKLRSGGAAVAGWLRNWFWQILAGVAVLALAFGLIRPFSQQRDPDAEDVAAAWSDSIQRLGIFSVYPPAEDFYVGDLWAVIGLENDGAQKLDPYLSTLVGKSARIGHIDLRQEMKEAHERQPVFSAAFLLLEGYVTHCDALAGLLRPRSRTC